MHRGNCFWTQTEGWEPPPKVGISGDPRRNQFHLRFSTGGLVERLRLPVVIRAEWKSCPAPSVQWRRDEDAETAVFPDAAVRVFHAGPTIANILCMGDEFAINDWGIS